MRNVINKWWPFPIQSVIMKAPNQHCTYGQWRGSSPSASTSNEGRGRHVSARRVSWWRPGGNWWGEIRSTAARDLSDGMMQTVESRAPPTDWLLISIAAWKEGQKKRIISRNLLLVEGLQASPDDHMAPSPSNDHELQLIIKPWHRY